MQKSALFVLALLSFLMLKAQEPIAQANKCYDEKNYQCAINFYSEALTNNKYQQKDYAVITYRLGYGYQQLEKHGDAIGYFQKAIERNPAMGEAYWSMAYSHFKTADYPKAIEFYQKATGYYTEAKDLGSLLYWKGRSYFYQKKYAEALSTLKEAMQKNPSYDGSYALAGDAAYNLANYKEATYYYSRSIETGSPEEKSAMAARHYWKGKGFFKLYKYDSAMLDFQKALEYDPAYKTAVWEIGAVYYNQNKWKEAAAQYSKTILLYTGDTASLKKLYNIRGYSYQQAKELVKAIEDYDAALKIDPLYREPLDHKAAIFWDQKKYREAIAIYSKAIEADKSNYYSPAYYAKRAKAYLILKDTAKAAEDLKTAQRYDVDGYAGEIYIELGNIHFGKKKYQEAAASYSEGLGTWDYYENNGNMSAIFLRKGISNLLAGNYVSSAIDLEQSIYYDSLNREAHRYLGEAWYRQNSLSSAVKEFTTSIRMYKDVKDSMAKLHSYRGRVYILQKDFQKALADYEMAEKLKPNQADIIAGIGQIAFETKEYAKVVLSFTKAIGLYKPAQKNELAFAYYARGRAHHELKNKVQATADITKAIELLPGYTEAKNWLATVKSASY